MCTDSSHTLPAFPPTLATFIARYQHSMLLRVAAGHCLGGPAAEQYLQLYGRLFIATVQAKGVGDARVPAHFNVGITWARSYQSAVERHVTSLLPAQFHLTVSPH
jgi:hypothetical protein